MRNISHNISSQVRYARNKARLSQEELATKIKMKKCSISRYEKGLRIPTITVLKKIANATGNNLIIYFEKKSQ